MQWNEIQFNAFARLNVWIPFPQHKIILEYYNSKLIEQFAE